MLNNNNLGQYPIPEAKIKALEEDLKLDKKEKIKSLKLQKAGCRFGQLFFYGLAFLPVEKGITMGYQVYETIVNNYTFDGDFYQNIMGLVVGTPLALVFLGGLGYVGGKGAKETAKEISELEKKLTV